MAYTKTNWQNDQGPAINDNNLNHIEEGIFNNDALLLVLLEVIGIDADTWVSTDTYSLGDIVIYQNRLYENITGNYTTTNPASDTTNWKKTTILVDSMAKINSNLIKQYFKNATNNSTTDGYSCDFINKLNTYSASPTEQRVGTWINGKPIYRKVISGSISSSTGTIQVPDLETLVKYYGNCTIAGGNDKRPFPFYELNTSGHLFDFSLFGDGYINYNSTWNVATYQITIEYTKTTD